MNSIYKQNRLNLPYWVFGMLSFFQINACAQNTSSYKNAVMDNTFNLFDYDKQADYQIHEDSVFQRGNTVVRDISYASCNPAHGRVKAYLVIPSGEQPHTGIIFFHWLGRPDGNRKEFLEEAIEFAGLSTMSILIQGYFPWNEKPVSGEKDRQQVIDQTVDLRRAVDILLEQPGIDPERIAFVGHDYGAMFGAIMAGIDKRIKAYVLVTGMGNFGDWSLKYWKNTASEGEETYRKSLAPFDPIGYIAKADPSALFFQFAEKDIFISKDVALDFFNAASEPKSMSWYNTGHEMVIPEVKKDRVEWLKIQLGIE